MKIDSQAWSASRANDSSKPNQTTPLRSLEATKLPGLGLTMSLALLAHQLSKPRANPRPVRNPGMAWRICQTSHSKVTPAASFDMTKPHAVVGLRLSLMETAVGRPAEKTALLGLDSTTLGTLPAVQSLLQMPEVI